MLSELIFFVTYGCNFRCRTCFYASYMDKTIANGVQELDIDEIKKVSFNIGRLNKLFISGGEPFLRQDLPEICEIFYRQNKIRMLHLPTNGWNKEVIYDYTLKVLKNCSGLCVFLSFSLDGLEDTHDEIKAMKGSFRKTIDAIQTISSLKNKFKNLKLYIITVVNNRNLDEVIKLSKFVKSLPVDGHGPSPMRGLAYDRRLSVPTPAQWEHLAQELIPILKHWNKKFNSDGIKIFLKNNRLKYLYNIYAKVLKGEKLPFKCQAGNTIAVLDASGDVRLCELSEPLGNVRQSGYDFKKILASEKAHNLKNGLSNCTCNHACFIGPSIKASPFAILKSCFWPKI